MRTRLTRHVSTFRTTIRTLAAAAAAGLILFGGAAAAAANPASPGAAATLRVAQIDLISDHTGGAPLADPNLINPWGLAFGPATPLWVANNGTDTSTIYRGGLDGAPVTPAFTVTIPSGGPTGQVFNPDTTHFMVTGPGGTGAAAFIFATESGDIVAWNRTASPTDAFVVAHVDGAIYKGLALVQTKFGPFLLAADFHGARVDVFDGDFHRVALPPAFFHDPRLPAGYAPFNVFATEDAVYVSYAKQDAEKSDEVAGRGLGFVDRYTGFGLRVQRVASRGTLNAPWGMAVAPASFGPLAGTLLVGNFGDGRIGVYRFGRFLGLLRGTDGAPLAIDGLWALLPGTATSGGTDNIWFSAGPADETQGLVGLLSPGQG